MALNCDTLPQREKNIIKNLLVALFIYILLEEFPIVNTVFLPEFSLF